MAKRLELRQEILPGMLTAMGLPVKLRVSPAIAGTSWSITGGKVVAECRHEGLAFELDIATITSCPGSLNEIV
jgi:hypothetical protein